MISGDMIARSGSGIARRGKVEGQMGPAARRKSIPVRIGGVTVGGTAPIGTHRVILKLGPAVIVAAIAGAGVELARGAAGGDGVTLEGVVADEF